MIICLQFRLLAILFASFSSLLGYVSDFAVTAMTFLPNTFSATFKRKLLSTPPENAIIKEPISLRIFFSLLIFFLSIIILIFLPGNIKYIKTYIFAIVLVK
ncbi:hypothetical protein ES703_55904 [subsurface metagenome]